MGDRLIGIAIYAPELKESYYIPFRHNNGENLDLDDLRLLDPVLVDKNKEYVGWNVKFDQHFLQVDGFKILENGVIYKDAIIALQLLDENRYDPMDDRHLNYKLKDNARLFLGDNALEGEDEIEIELHRLGLGKGDLKFLSPEIVGKYAEEDVVNSWDLYQVFLPYLEKWDQIELFNELADFNSRTLARMEYSGTPVNRDRIIELIDHDKLLADQALLDLKQKFGNTFNPNSPNQVKEALGTKNGQRTTLERLDDPYATHVIDYKYLTKAKGTFYQPYLYRSSFDGRIHPTFNVARTTSGRLSSSDPNLQQVPRYSSKYRVKEVFIAPEGYRLVQLDYSQQELRLACYFSGQENMTAEYLKTDADVHTLTTAQLFKIPYEVAKEDEEKRQIGKVANFGFSYGMGIMKAATYIASSLKRTLYIDKRFYEDHIKALPKVDSLPEPIYSPTEKHLYISTDEWGGNEVVREVSDVVGYTEGKRDMTWDEFQARFAKYYAGTEVVKDAKKAEALDPDSISIWTTTEILTNWKHLYGKFIEKLKEYAKLASEKRNPNGSLGGQYKFMRLEDNRVRHYIKGQSPFTAWNFLIQGTGALIMRRSLMRINARFGIDQDQVIPIITVHDSVVLLVKQDQWFDANIEAIKQLMETYSYVPSMKVDIKIGKNWGQLEKWKQQTLSI